MTLVVLDKHSEGVPVAWMISNRQDSLMLVEFFKAVKSWTRIVSTQWFMSDDAEQFLTARQKNCCVQYSSGQSSASCSTRAHNKQAQRIELYHQLRLLLTELDKSTFN